jgi:hypothetical protein
MTVPALIHFFFLLRSDCRAAFKELPEPCPLELPGPEFELPEPCPLELPGPEFGLPLEELPFPLFEALDVPGPEPGVTEIPELPGLTVVPALPFPCVDPPLDTDPVPEDELPEFPVDVVPPLVPPGDELVPAPELPPEPALALAPAPLDPDAPAPLEPGAPVLAPRSAPLEPEDEPVLALAPPAEAPPTAETPPPAEAPAPEESPPLPTTLAEEFARDTSWLSVSELLAP